MTPPDELPSPEEIAKRIYSLVEEHGTPKIALCQLIAAALQARDDYWKAQGLRDIVNNDSLLELARLAIEETLIDWRESRISELRNNGLVIKEKDGSPSNVIRFGPESAMKIGLLAIQKYFDSGQAQAKRAKEPKVFEGVMCREGNMCTDYTDAYRDVLDSFEWGKRYRVVVSEIDEGV